MPTISGTTNVDLTSTEWTKISEGPCTVEKKRGPNVFLHFGSSLPDISEEAYVILDADNSFTNGHTFDCYARTVRGDGVVTVIGETVGTFD